MGACVLQRHRQQRSQDWGVSSRESWRVCVPRAVSSPAPVRVAALGGLSESAEWVGACVDPVELTMLLRSPSCV